MSELSMDREILAALARPFPEDQIKYVPKGGVRLAYITARHAMNRLDEVVGPGSWSDDYITFGENGVKCMLTVEFPNPAGGPSETVSVTKCGIGGAAGMQDEDDDEKSAESSAFKRAAVKFGIGRWLYQNGLPDFCLGAASTATAPRHASSGPQQPRQAPTQPRYSGQVGGRQFDNFKIPPPGKAVFAWAKNIGGHYRVDLVSGMSAAGKEMEKGTNFTAWSTDTVEEICLRTIRYIKSLDNYDGKFDHIDTDSPESDDDGNRDKAPWE